MGTRSDWCAPLKKEEEINLTEYENFQYCYQNIDRFLNDVYMNKRIHYH